MSTHLVDVVIPTHTPRRPVERAIASALDGAPQGTRVILVCHGLPAADVLPRIPEALLAHVTPLELEDGLRSPAGPFMAGVDAATATYVCSMSSDDYVRPGALSAWAEIAERTAADAVLARVETDGGRLLRYPPTRGGRRTTNLDFDRDRLAYHTVPQGLVRRDLYARTGARYTAGLVSGEDVALTTRLWSEGRRLAFALHAPAYVLSDDVDDRVSLALRPVAEDFECIDHLAAEPWFRDSAENVREAAAVKLLRIHVFGAITARGEALTDDDRLALAAACQKLLDVAPRLPRLLSVAEDRLVRGIRDGADARELAALVRRRNRHGHPDTIRTADPRYVLHRQAPLRLMVASALMR